MSSLYGLPFWYGEAFESIMRLYKVAPRKGPVEETIPKYFPRKTRKERMELARRYHKNHMLNIREALRRANMECSEVREVPKYPKTLGMVRALDKHWEFIAALKG